MESIHRPETAIAHHGPTFRSGLTTNCHRNLVGDPHQTRLSLQMDDNALKMLLFNGKTKKVDFPVKSNNLSCKIWNTEYFFIGVDKWEFIRQYFQKRRI